jgi:chromosome segregation ATPase
VEELQRLVQAYDELQEQAERQEAENEELRAKCRKLQEQVKRERTAKTRMRNSLRSAVLEREEVASKLHEAEERLGAVLQELSELRANDASPEKSEKRQPPLDELWQRIAEWVRGS